MASVLVIGVGSDLRRDDAAGRRVAEEIERLELDGMTVIVTTQLLPELVEPISAADLVVFADASVEVGEVTVTEVEPVAGSGDSHRATPGALLGLATRLGVTIPPALLVEIPAHDLSLGEGLSTRTAALIEPALTLIRRIVDPNEPAG